MKRLLRIPYHGALAMLRPENGTHVAALSEITGERALRNILMKLRTSNDGRSKL